MEKEDNEAEEEEEEELENSDTIDNFFYTMQNAHRGNKNSKYFSQDYNEDRRDITICNKFIFEYFIFNSIYNVNWEKSNLHRKILTFDYKIVELSKQNQFIKFLKAQTSSEQISKFISNILKFKNFGVFDKVAKQQIDRNTKRNGKEFCDYVRSIQKLNGNTNIEGKFFKQLKSSLRFIYAVRNNIFHGSKKPGQYWDESQKVRIGLYTQLIEGANELFFERGRSQ